MPHMYRRTAPKVEGGRVLRKNRHTLTPNCWSTQPDTLVIDRERPGRGYRHLLRREDILDFINILPDWDELAVGLRAVVLAQGRPDYFGMYHHVGVIRICAWPRDLWIDWSKNWFQTVEPIVSRLGVPTEECGSSISLRFTESQVRAFQLLAVFLHELGHHHDRMTTRRRYRTARGESFAESYALRHADVIWDRYVQVFGQPY